MFSETLSDTVVRCSPYIVVLGLVVVGHRKAPLLSHSIHKLTELNVSVKG